jgi:hypothetical protein
MGEVKCHPDDAVDDEESTEGFFLLAELMNMDREEEGLPPLHPADAVSHLAWLLETYGEN